MDKNGIFLLFIKDFQKGQKQNTYNIISFLIIFQFHANTLYLNFRTGSTCGSVEIGCSVPYSFKNQLPLSEDENAFIVSLKIIANI